MFSDLKKKDSLPLVKHQMYKMFFHWRQDWYKKGQYLWPRKGEQWEKWCVGEGKGYKQQQKKDL